MTDWCGRRLCLENHERSLGRVVACGNGDLHREAVKILGEEWGGDDDVILGKEKEKEKKRRVFFSDGLVYLAVGIGLGMVLARSR
mmetsp:Transcript_18127/g.36647  ORF Transcript_18127/g.36647 Transcript_18127/m.36647 type:complete len:85 (+) Transcript_18127:1-255(+)